MSVRVDLFGSLFPYTTLQHDSNYPFSKMSKRKLNDAETELILTKAQAKLIKKLNLNKAQVETVDNILSEGEDDLRLLLELFRKATSQLLGASVRIQNTNMC